MRRAGGHCKGVDGQVSGGSSGSGRSCLDPVLAHICSGKVYRVDFVFPAGFPGHSVGYASGQMAKQETLTAFYFPEEL